MKKVYLFPKNDISEGLAKKQTFKDKYVLLGFIDNNKNEAIKLNEIQNDFDLIIICSPNYCYDINSELKDKNIISSRIKFYVHNLDRYINHIDLVPYLTHNRLSDFLYLKKLKNKHKNKRAFLIGNGPSLKNEDLDKLKNEISFAANKIFLAYEEIAFRPMYYLVEDDLVYKQNRDKIEQLENSIKLFPLFSLNWAEEIRGAYYFNLNYKPSSNKFPFFNPNPIKSGMFWGSTIVFTMIQWAIYMGIKEIYLLGVDFNFKESSSYEINNNRKDLICEGEVNHFHKDYRKIGEKWNLPNLDIQVKTFSKAKEYCDKFDIKIYNASRQTKLDVFEKINFDKLF